MPNYQHTLLFSSQCKILNSQTHNSILGINLSEETKLENFEELLKQYKTLAKKLKDVNEELEKLIESVRVKGVITLTSANWQIFEQISKKRKERDEVYKELRKIEDYMLKLMREAKSEPK